MAEITGLAFGPDAMRAIENGVDESERMRHPFVGRIHLFIGLVQEAHQFELFPFNAKRYPDLLNRLRTEAKKMYSDPYIRYPEDRIMPVVKVILRDAESFARKNKQLFISADDLMLSTLKQELYDEAYLSGGILHSVGYSKAMY